MNLASRNLRDPSCATALSATLWVRNAQLKYIYIIKAMNKIFSLYLTYHLLWLLLRPDRLVHGETQAIIRPVSTTTNSTDSITMVTTISVLSAFI